MNKETKEYVQNLFNLGWQKFVVERAPRAYDPDKGCQYRTAKGHKCLIGLVIPDGHPGQAVQGGVYKLWQVHPDLRPAGVERTYVSAAQGTLHDNLDCSGHTREHVYREFARVYNLTIPGEA